MNDQPIHVMSSERPSENGEYRTKDVLLAMITTATLIVGVAQVVILYRLDKTTRSTNTTIALGLEVSKDNNRILRGREVIIIQPGHKNNVRRGEVSPQTQGKPVVKPQNYVPSL